MTHPYAALISQREKKSEEFIPVIMKIVAEQVNIPQRILQMKTRKREIVEARQIIMSLAKTFTNASLAKIGEKIGVSPDKFDHATVLHACKTVDNLIGTNKDFRVKYNTLRTRILMYLDSSKLMVCSICGGVDVRVKGWINPNTEQFISHVKEYGLTDKYCNNCKNYVELEIRKQESYDGKHSVAAIPNSLQEIN